MGFIARLRGEEPGLLARIPHVLKGSGHYGEYLTDFALSNDNLPGRLKTYTNLLVPRRGKSTKASEVDVLVLHEKGVFVCESKNYSGWIFGSAESSQWTVTFPGNEKYRLFNPIFQNRAHVNALVEYLGLPKYAFASYIVFSERCELKKVPENTTEFRICQRQNLLSYMRYDLAQRRVLFEPEQFDALAAKLDELKAASTDSARMEHVAEAAAAAHGTKCPSCGRELVERHRRSDGHAFIGCSGWPSCHYTRNTW